MTTSRSESLFKIEAGLNNLIAAREECETEEGREAFTEQIREYVAQEIRKVDSIAEYRLYCEMHMDAAEEEYNRAKAFREMWKSRLAAVDDATMYAMQSFGEKRLEGATHEVRLHRNGGLAPLVINNPELIPDKLCMVTMSMRAHDWLKLCTEADFPYTNKTCQPDNERIREALKGRVPCPKCKGEGSVELESVPHPIAGQSGRESCPVCEGKATVPASVPGAHLGPRGEHLRWL